MFGSLGAPELIIIGLIVVLLFGVGKISGLGRELGSSIKEFRRAVKDPDQEAKEALERQQQAAAVAPPPAPVQPQQQYTPPPAQPPQTPAAHTPGDNKNIF
jgi:sec-independent protein translocase protein TatA